MSRELFFNFLFKYKNSEGWNLGGTLQIQNKQKEAVLYKINSFSDKLKTSTKGFSGLQRRPDKFLEENYTEAHKMHYNYTLSCKQWETNLV